jgi:single-strand DNA-binding protein
MSFSVANNTGFGEKQKTHFFDCSMFGKRAEGKLKDYMLKGQQVVVEGEISLNQYQKKDGTGGASLNVFVNNVELMGSNQKSGSNQQSGSQPSADPTPSEDDDLPF